MKRKYSKPSFNMNSYYKIHNNNNVMDYNNQPCFSGFSQSNSYTASKIEVFCPVHDTSYKVDDIKRWIADLNEMGFECTYDGIKNSMYCFTIPIEKSLHKKKGYSVSVMMLIRYLYHMGINHIIDYYFQLVDEIDGVDKFKALQAAHQLWPDGEYGGNTNHMTSFVGISKSITRDELFKKISNEPDWTRCNITGVWTPQGHTYSEHKGKTLKTVYNNLL